MTVTDKDFEDMYAFLNRKETDTGRAFLLRDLARKANADNSFSQLLMYIEEISRRSLWQDEWDHGRKYKTLKEWAECEVGPIYVNENTETTLTIIVRIVENVFSYIHRHNLQDKDSNPITSKYILKNVGWSRLKIVSKHFPDDIKTDLRDEILINLTTDFTDMELISRYSESRIAPIQSIENVHPDTGTDILMFGLDSKQINAIRNALRKLTIHQLNIKLSPTEREVLLSSLPLTDNNSEDDINN